MLTYIKICAQNLYTFSVGPSKINDSSGNLQSNGQISQKAGQQCCIFNLTDLQG
jgi:hypothetical protein